MESWSLGTWGSFCRHNVPAASEKSGWCTQEAWVWPFLLCVQLNVYRYGLVLQKEDH